MAKYHVIYCKRYFKTITKTIEIPDGEVDNDEEAEDWINNRTLELFEDDITQASLNYEDYEFDFSKQAGDVAEDLEDYLKKDDQYFCEAHLEGWFHKYRGLTLSYVPHFIRQTYDFSGEIENAENELGRELGEDEVKLVKDRFIEAVVNNFIDTENVIYGYYDSLGSENYKSIDE